MAFLRLCQKAEKKGVEKVYLALHQLESVALVTPPCDVPGPDTVRVRQDPYVMDMMSSLNIAGILLTTSS